MLIAGIGVVVLSAMLTVALPSIGLGVVNASSADGQGVLVAVEFVARVLEGIAPPLGAALIAAGVAIAAMDRRAAAVAEGG